MRPQTKAAHYTFTFSIYPKLPCRQQRNPARPVQTTTFLTKLNTALSIFDDEISSLGEQRTTAYETFITAYQTAFTDIWPKIQTANVTTLLNSVTDTELRALKRLSEQLCPDPKTTLIKEK